MTVIDVDAHFFEPFDWYETRFPELAKEIPPLDPLTVLVTTGFGDVLGSLPPKALPADPIDRLPLAIRETYRNATAEQREGLVRLALAQVQNVPGAWKPAERLAWMDAQGIDRQLVLPTFAFTPIARKRREQPALTARLISAYNTWACETLAGHTDRLVPVGILDFETMDDALLLAELERLRRAGGRSFVFWPTPARGKSLAHPDFDRIWAACVDLGIVPMVHVGGGRPAFDERWLDNGRAFPMSLATYLGQLHQLPEIFLTEMIVNGVLERHPALRLFVCELGIDWLPEWMRRLDRGRNFAAQMGGERWPHPLKPSEYARRHILVSPLEMDPVLDVVDAIGPEMIVFSSDYPHPEGGKDARARFASQLADRLDAGAQARFFGGAAAEALAIGA